MTPAAVMDGACNEFLARARLTVDQNRAVGWGDRLHLAQQILQCGTLPHDLLETMQLLDLLLVIRMEALLLQPVFELSELVMSKVILNRAGHLCGNERQKANFLVAICVCRHTADEQSSEFVLRASQGNGTYGLNTSRQALQDMALQTRLVVERSNHQCPLLLIRP